MKPSNIGQAIRHVRKTRGMSQRDVERRAGITRNYLTRVEAGLLVPTLGNLDRLAKALDLETWKLIRLCGRMELATHNYVNQPTN